MTFKHNDNEPPCLNFMIPAPFTESCDTCIFEAWERMTYGGIRAYYETIYSPAIFISIEGSLHWVPLMDHHL